MTPPRSYFLPAGTDPVQPRRGRFRKGLAMAAAVVMGGWAGVGIWGSADEDALPSSALTPQGAYQDPWRQLASATAQADDLRPAEGRLGSGASLADCRGLLLSMMAKDPAAAWRLALRWASQRPDWAQALVDPLLEPLWQRRMFDVMLQGLDQSPDLEASLNSAWTEATLARWTETAPTQAAAWAADRAAQTGLSTGSADLLAVVNDRWAHQDARSATVFASTLPPAIGRPLLTESLNRWLALDGLAARSWIRAQGVNPALDASIAQHATADELARQSPQDAVDLVHRIADPSLRQQAQWALARTFRDIDPARQDWQTQALTGGQALPADDSQSPLPE